MLEQSGIDAITETIAKYNDVTEMDDMAMTFARCLARIITKEGTDAPAVQVLGQILNGIYGKIDNS